MNVFVVQKNTQAAACTFYSSILTTHTLKLALLLFYITAVLPVVLMAEEGTGT